MFGNFFPSNNPNFENCRHKNLVTEAVMAGAIMEGYVAGVTCPFIKDPIYSDFKRRTQEGAIKDTGSVILKYWCSKCPISGMSDLEYQQYRATLAQAQMDATQAEAAAVLMAKRFSAGESVIQDSTQS